MIDQISEITPRGKEFLFFSLFGIIGKTSSFVGPFVSSAIIDHANNSSGNDSTSLAFYFLMPVSLVSTVGLIVGVNVRKSKKEQDIFLAEELAERERLESSVRAGVRQ